MQPWILASISSSPNGIGIKRAVRMHQIRERSSCVYGLSISLLRSLLDTGVFSKKGNPHWRWHPQLATPLTSQIHWGLEKAMRTGVLHPSARGDSGLWRWQGESIPEPLTVCAGCSRRTFELSFASRAARLDQWRLPCVLVGGNK